MKSTMTVKINSDDDDDDDGDGDNNSNVGQRSSGCSNDMTNKTPLDFFDLVVTDDILDC